MDWIQVIVIIGSMLAMFLWLRAEVSADRREAHLKYENERKETTRMIFDVTNMVLTESREFHGRMTKLEERNQK